jgi:hypothetical protein
MKGGLRESSLSAVKFLLTRQQTFAEQTLRALQGAPLVKALVVRDEHVAHVVGVV